MTNPTCGGGHDDRPRERMTTDAQLLRAAHTDSKAFRELYDRYAVRMYRFHLARSRDADAAHDLTAETFAQAWLGRTRFEDVAGGSAGPWLFGIARNVLSASVRRGRLERSASSRLGILERLDREPAAVEPEETWLEGLDEALAELPESQLDALRLSLGAVALAALLSLWLTRRLPTKALAETDVGPTEATAVAST